MILRCTLHEEEVLIVRNLSPLRVTSNACANILRTCQQMCDEGTRILYGENVFTVLAEHANFFHRHFLPAIGPSNMAMITQLKFNLDTLNYGYLLDPAVPVMVQTTPGLRSLVRMTWDVDSDVVREDPFSIIACVWSATVCRLHLPRLATYDRSQDQRGAQRISIFE